MKNKFTQLANLKKPSTLNQVQISQPTFQPNN